MYLQFICVSKRIEGISESCFNLESFLLFSATTKVGDGVRLRSRRPCSSECRCRHRLLSCLPLAPLSLLFHKIPADKTKQKKMSSLKRLHILLITSLLLALPSYLPLSCPLLWFPVGGLRRNLIDPVNILCLPPPMRRRAGVRRVVAQRLCCKSEYAAVTYIYSLLVVSRRLCSLLDSPVLHRQQKKCIFVQYRCIIAR